MHVSCCWIAFGAICFSLLAMGCRSNQNYNPIIRGPQGAFFSVGVENVLELSVYDVDGDPLTVTFELDDSERLSEPSSRPTLTKITGGALFTWLLGAEDSDLVGTSQLVRFTVSDGAGGRDSLAVRIAVVDPLRYGNRALRLSGHQPDGYLVEGKCIEPTMLGVTSGGDGVELIEFDLAHAPFDCSDEDGCLPRLERLSSTERKLSWCLRQELLNRSLDHEVSVSVGILQGTPGFEIPLTYRFLSNEETECGLGDPMEFSVVESAMQTRFIDLRLAIHSSGFERPMLSSFRHVAGLNAPLHGLPIHNLTWLGGDQWSVRILLDAPILEGESIGLIVTGIANQPECEVVRRSAPITLTFREPSDAQTTIVSDVCTPCSSDSDCPRGRCLILDGQGRCGVDCETPNDCALDQFCQRTETLSGARATQCVPSSASCLSSCDVDFPIDDSFGQVDAMSMGEALRDNACIGDAGVYTLSLAQGEGVRIKAEPIASGLALGMSVWMNGSDFWSTWASSPDTVFELPCAREALRLTTKVWPWRGQGSYRLQAESLVGGCRDVCADDALERDGAVQVVAEPTEFEGLSLCDLDNDAYELDISDGEVWSVALNEVSEGSEIQLRVLSLPLLENTHLETMGQSDVVTLSELGAGQYRVILSSAASQSVARYTVDFLRSQSPDVAP